MPYTVELPKREITLNTRNKKIIALFQEAAGEIHANGRSTLSNAAISGEAHQRITNSFARTIRSAVGFSVDVLKLESRTYFLDSAPYKTREDYVVDLTSYLHNELNLAASASEPMSDVLDNEFALVRELIIRLVTVALSNQSAETPSGFSGNTQNQASSSNQLSTTRNDEDHQQTDNAPKVTASAKELINANGFNFIAFMRLFIQKLIHDYQKNLLVSTNALHPIWLNRLQNLKLYFSSHEHNTRLERIERVKDQLALLKSNKRILTEKLNLLNEVFRLLKRSLIFRLVQPLQNNVLNIDPSYLSDDWLDVSLYKAIAYFLNKSREGIRQFNRVQGNNQQLIAYRVSNEHDRALVHTCLTSPDIINEIIRNTGVNGDGKNKLVQIFELYGHTQYHLEFFGHLSDMNEIIGWLLMFSRMVSLDILADMLNTHLNNVKNATSLSYNDPAARHPLFSAVNTNKVFLGKFGGNFDSLKTLEDPSLVKFISNDFYAHCGGLLSLNEKMSQLPGYKPEMVDKNKIEGLLKHMGITAPRARQQLPYQ